LRGQKPQIIIIILVLALVLGIFNTSGLTNNVLGKNEHPIEETIDSNKIWGSGFVDPLEYEFIEIEDTVFITILGKYCAIDWDYSADAPLDVILIDTTNYNKYLTSRPFDKYYLLHYEDGYSEYEDCNQYPEDEYVWYFGFYNPHLYTVNLEFSIVKYVDMAASIKDVQIQEVDGNNDKYIDQLRVSFDVDFPASDYSCLSTIKVRLVNCENGYSSSPENEYSSDIEYQNTTTVEIHPSTDFEYILNPDGKRKTDYIVEILVYYCWEGLGFNSEDDHYKDSMANTHELFPENYGVKIRNIIIITLSISIPSIIATITLLVIKRKKNLELPSQLSEQATSFDEVPEPVKDSTVATPEEKTIFCYSCGHPNQGDEIFCGSCGETLVKK